MKTLTEVKTIIDDIKYKNWNFVLEEITDGFLVHCEFYAKDNRGIIETEELQCCRKMFIKKDAELNHIVRTAFKAVQIAEEHELCENFKYKNVALFDPHKDYTKGLV